MLFMLVGILDMFLSVIYENFLEQVITDLFRILALRTVV
jgi:hypothetical protein